jgi:heptosyltransferase-1/heptosyltransferase-2
VKSTLTQPERILIIRPSALGDVARTVPALVSLRSQYADAHIDWLVQRGFEDVIRAHPALTQVVSFDRRRLGQLARRGAVCPAIGFLRYLRLQGYDLVVDLQGLARSGLFAWATGASQRVGDRRAREFGWLGLNQRLAIEPDLHTVDQMLEIVRGAGAEPIADMRLYTPPEDRDAAESDRALESPFAVVAPTSRWPSKRWPEDRFVAVARHLIDRKLKVIVVGGPDEREQCPRLLDLCRRDQRVIDRIGRTSIGGLMAIIERCDLLIANDSAALHIGVGFGRKLIGLYGPTRIERVGPYRRQRDVIQYLREDDDLQHKRDVNVSLMERIPVEEVVDRADSLLAEPKARRRD